MSALAKKRLTPRPMRRGRAARYPTRLEVVARPELLRRHMPGAWLSRAELAAAAAAFLAANVTGCSPEREPGPSDAPKAVLESDAAAIVAPVFNHGRGLSAGGCVVVVAPVYLSEEEAISIIRDELAQYGINFSERHVELPGVIIYGHRYRQDHDWITGNSNRGFVEVVAPLELDLRDPVKMVAIKYVNEQEYLKLGGEPPDLSSSADCSDDRALAGSVAAAVKAQARGMYFGAFYDPICGYNWRELLQKPRDAADSRESWEVRMKAAEEQARQESIILLRQQVKDFADWLKAQGVI